MMSRFRFKRQVAHGLFPGAAVARGHDWRWKDQDGESFQLLDRGDPKLFVFQCHRRSG